MKGIGLNHFNEVKVLSMTYYKNMNFILSVEVSFWNEPYPSII